MNYCIDIDSLIRKNFQPLPEIPGKGWSYSSVYFLEDIKDLYMFIFSKGGYTSIKELCEEYNNLDIGKENTVKWTKRQILEIVNALKNFELISQEGIPLKGHLFNSLVGAPLTLEDEEVFLDIYLNYFRFKEFHRLFLNKENFSIDELKENSKMILSAIMSGRFTNLFLLFDTNEINAVELMDEYSSVKRFWDVYLKWGMRLNVLEKFPIKQVGIKTNPRTKSLQSVYFSQPMPNEFSVFNYLKTNFRESYIYIPDVIFNVAKDFRYTLYDIKKKLLFECMNSDEYRAQSTSAFYIENKENFLFPKLGNTYITHLLKI